MSNRPDTSPVSANDPMTLLEASVRCPFCWEVITLLIDPSCDNQCYIEDCHVCCRPIELTVTTESGRLCSLQAERSD